jgi:hypothetical protein
MSGSTALTRFASRSNLGAIEIVVLNSNHT